MGILASAGFSLQNYQGAAAADPTERLFSALISLAVSYVIVGPIVLAAEGARDRTGRFTGALASLPISGRRVHLLVWAPTLLLVLMMSALLFPPAVASLLGAGLSLADALAYAGAAMSLGVGSAAAAIVTVSLILRGNKWSVVRAPVSYLAWAAIAVVEIAASIGVLSGGDVPGWLLFPRMVADLAEGVVLDAVVGTASVGVGAVAVASLLLLSAERFETISHGRVIVRWGSGLCRGRIVGELLYAFRDASTAANVSSALLLSWGVLALVYRLPESTHQQALPWAVSAILLCAGAGARGLRGVFPARRTPQQLIGVGLANWFTSQTLISCLVVSLVGVPAVLLPGAISSHGIPLLVSLMLSTASCTVVCGWVLVVRNENAMGQVLATFAFLGLGAALNGFVSDAIATSPVAPVVGVSALVIGLLVSAAVERARWTYRRASGRHRALSRSLG